MLRFAALALVVCSALVLCLSTLASAQDYPALSGRVVDTADLLPPEDERALARELQQLEQAQGHQVVVATVPSLGGRDIESYANGLFREWKLGRANENDGVLFLVARDDRQTRIEVGYGLEGTLTDTEASLIVQGTVLPQFRGGRFARGIVAGTQAIADKLWDSDLPRPARPSGGTRSNAPDGGGSGWINVLLFLVFFVGPFLFGRRRGRKGRGRTGRGRMASGRRGRGGLPGVILLPGPGMGGGFGGGLGGGGFGGGFGGGGGSSGGGGASGSW